MISKFNVSYNILFTSNIISNKTQQCAIFLVFAKSTLHVVDRYIAGYYNFLSVKTDGRDATPTQLRSAFVVLSSGICIQHESYFILKIT